MEFDDAQRVALNKLYSGCILCGDVGSGKSRTSLAYYFTKECGGSFEPSYIPMKNPKDLYIITTAKKRDGKEWEEEMVPFKISSYDIKVVVDSWNNIGKYTDVHDSVFIFDEQRLVGSGAWVKAFYKITKKNQNHWLLLSATPGDTWSDYIPVFVANGFFKNKTEFNDKHAVFDRFSKFPRIKKWVDESVLIRFRDSILVDIEVKKKTIRIQKDISVPYDEELFKKTMKERWNYFDNEPITDAAQLCYTLRKIVNLNENRIETVKQLIEEHKKVIIFYNFDYELEMLRQLAYKIKITKAEWNGHKHEPLPDGESWIYLVQYTAGAEGWNCITTDTIIFYSLNYSYKTTAQSAGRIDRRNTPYTYLYYYYLKTNSWIDRAIKKALSEKRTFNESRFYVKHKTA